MRAEGLPRQGLSDELREYGYVFSAKKSVFLYSFAAAAMLLLGRFFSLPIFYRLILVCALVIILPFFIRNAAKNRFIQQRFSDTSIYIEQFLYSFKRSKKILSALCDVNCLFEGGRMKNAILRAIDHIRHTYNEADVESHALSIIEKEHPGRVIKMVHRFALDAEKLGGNCDDQILLLLNYRRMMADRIYELLLKKRRERRNVFFSIASSLILCSGIYFISGRLNVDISKNALGNIVTTAVLVFDLFIFYRADSFLSASDEEEKEEDDEMEEVYKRMLSCNTKLPLDLLKRHAAKKRVKRAIERDYPIWLLETSLLIQNENVQVAITKSYANAPPVLRIPLKKLIYDLKMDPDKVEPYLSFLSEFSLPEVRSSMKMLYSLSIGAGGDASAQITDIIRRNQLLFERSERSSQEDRLSRLYALFLLPQLSGGLKLICDMLLLFFGCVSSLG